MLCLIYTHSPSGAARPRASCVYIRQSTLACVITITYIYIYMYIYIYVYIYMYIYICIIYIYIYIYVTGFAKTVLKGTFCISRNTNLKY